MPLPGNRTPHRLAVRAAGWLVGVTAVGLLLVVVGYWPFWDDFLGPADFQGHAIPPPALVQWSAPATFNGFYAMFNVDRALVEALLPPGWVLAARSTNREPGKHPVALAFGDQTDIMAPSLTGPQPTGTHYSETVLAVPFVQQAARPGWHLYMVRLYADDAAAVAAAPAWGYPKQKAWLWWTGWEAAVRTLTGADILSGRLAMTSAWWKGPDALGKLHRFDDLHAMWTTRVLGTHPVTGTPVCSFFEWDPSDARVGRAATSHRFLLPPRPDMTAWPGLGDHANTVHGAFVVLGLRGRLSQPLPCV